MSLPSDLMAKLLALPCAERESLAYALLDSLEDDEPVDDEAAADWSDEIVRRAEAIEAGPADLVDGPSALAELRDQLRGTTR